MNATLQALVEGKPPGASPLAPPPNPKQAVQKLNYSHEAMVNLIIANPAISGNELAEIFGYSASWISTIITSDLFQAKLEERRAEFVDPELRLSIKTQMNGLLHRSLEILQHKLSKKPDEVPDQLALQTAKIMGQNLGHGNEVKVSIEQTNTHLHELGDNLVGLLRRRKAEVALEGEFSHVVQRDEEQQPDRRLPGPA